MFDLYDDERRKVTCPKCNAVVNVTEQEIDNDRAYCERCKLTFRLSKQTDREVFFS